MRSLPEPTVPGCNDAELAKRISLAWLNYAQVRWCRHSSHCIPPTGGYVIVKLGILQDPNANQHERIQQLRENITRDLALESTTGSRRRAVTPPPVLEPRRFVAASRLEVGRLKQRFERSEPCLPKHKQSASVLHPSHSKHDGGTRTPQALKALSSLEICHAKQLLPPATQQIYAYHCSRILHEESRHEAKNSDPTNAPCSKQNGQAIQPAQQYPITSASEALCSQSFIETGTDTRKQGIGLSPTRLAMQGSCKKAVNTAAGTSAGHPHGVKRSWGLSSAGTAETDHCFRCVLSRRYIARHDV